MGGAHVGARHPLAHRRHHGPALDHHPERRHREAHGVAFGEEFLERALRLDFSAVVNHDAIADILDISDLEDARRWLEANVEIDLEQFRRNLDDLAERAADFAGPEAQGNAV